MVCDCSCLMHWHRRLFNLIKRSRFLVIFAFITQNFLFWLKAHLRLFKSTSGTQSAYKDVSECVKKVDYNMDLYLRQFSVPLEDRVVLEVGPGDNLGTALEFIRLGAKKVVCLDAFDPVRNVGKERAIYEALIKRAKPSEQKLMHKACKLSADGFVFDQNLIVYRTGAPIEEYSGPQVDVIVSKSVMEHVADVHLSMKNMLSALRPGGHMVHFVDTRDHGMFSQVFHPLEWLTIHPRIWHWMTSCSGHPNRVLLPEYRSLLADVKYEVLFWDVYGLEEPLCKKRLPSTKRLVSKVGIDKVRDRLVQPYLSYPSKDLLVGSFLLYVKN